jgi:hypothetical protein
MAGTIDGGIKLVVSARVKDSAENSVSQDEALINIVRDLVHGTGAGQVNKLWHDRRTLGNAATEDIDLSGTLENRLGEAQVFTSIRLLVIVNRSSTMSLELSRKSTTGAHFFKADGDAVSIKPGGFFILGDLTGTGYTVTNTTDDHVTLTNEGATEMEYDILVAGGG